MDYTIITINDNRMTQKQAIRDNVKLNEVFPEFVNGNDDEQLFSADEKWNLRKHCGLQRGEWGIWFSNLNCWEYAASNDGLIIFEDDAIVDSNFMHRYDRYISDIPQDTDFIALWVPDNQRQDYLYNVEFDAEGKPKVVRGSLQPDNSIFNIDHEYIAKAYQGYGGVAMLVTKQGGGKLIELAQRYGQWSTSDCFYFLETHRNNLNGYALKPDYCDLVYYDWSVPTTIHTTEFIDLTLGRII
jgi:GR25 family glycosyltransferase involved in LPS biosynthesis